MPNVPIPDYTQFKGLIKLESKIERRVELYTEEKAIKAALDEINRPLFEKISGVLPQHVKSIAFGGHQITPIQGEPRKNFKREKLLNSVFNCPHCGKGVTVPMKTLDKAYVPGKLPKPTVSVRPIKESDGGGGSNGEDDDE